MNRDPWTETTAPESGVLRFMTCGSVDDGKSTLIGRLLFDTRALLSDTLATMQRHAERQGLAAPDLALLTDGLIAEREQGITIDVAYRYFATARRKFVIADSPGHEQHTRNMVTAASTADAAVLLVDARKGLLTQTRRHAALAALLNVRHLVLAVNKMDLVGHAQPVFEAIVDDFRAWLAGHGGLAGGRALPQVSAVPLSALQGDMVVERGQALGWWRGPTLIDLLESLPGGGGQGAGPSGAQAGTQALRLPVQWVCRPVGGGRAPTGRIDSGTLAVGDEVVVWPTGQRSRVARLTLGERELARAQAGQSVMVWLADERDVSRGDLLVRADEPPVTALESFTATVCWLSARPLQPGITWQLRHGTRELKARVEAVDALLDVQTLDWVGAGGPATLQLNDIGRLRLRTQPLPALPYGELRAGGSFILVDPATRDTVAAGWVD
jgi:sulfate adenylyltransferase subunit 1